METAELLLSFGTDPSFLNPLGQTPAQVASRRGVEDVAELIDEAADQWLGRTNKSWWCRVPDHKNVAGRGTTA